MARSSRGAPVRIALGVGGALLLAFAWVYSRLPRPDSPREEAALRVVGVYDGTAFSWLLRTAHGAALVDAGMDRDGKAILEELHRQGLGPDSVHTVLLTHGHPDHFAAAHLFRNAKVYAGPGEAALIRGERRSTRPFARFAGALGHPLPPPPANLTELGGGEALDVDGEEVRVFHVPGHTPGSLVFLWRELLFTGDALLGDGGSVRPAPSFFSEDPERGRESLRPLVQLPFTLMADGHAGVTADARQKLERLLR